jgi:HEAT repeat protein
MKQQARQWWQQAACMVRAAGNQPQVFAEWIECLASRDPQIAVPATWALQQAGAAVIPALVQGLQHSHSRIRRGCVDSIDHGGYGADARCVAGLLPLLHDPVPHIRRAVWHTLFCERCQDTTKCEQISGSSLDKRVLLEEIGIHDPNPKLRAELEQELANCPPAL